MLVPSLYYHFANKRDSEKDAIRLVGLSSFKIVLIFLAETVVVKV